MELAAISAATSSLEFFLPADALALPPETQPAPFARPLDGQCAQAIAGLSLPPFVFAVRFDLSRLSERMLAALKISWFARIRENSWETPNALTRAIRAVLVEEEELRCDPVRQRTDFFSLTLDAGDSIQAAEYLAVLVLDCAWLRCAARLETADAGQEALVAAEFLFAIAESLRPFLGEKKARGRSAKKRFRFLPARRVPEPFRIAASAG